jgi:GrpB-like predicted nucleotidyltransferase (UPF0157 family)
MRGDFVKLVENTLGKSKEDPCWDGYQQIGTKEKKGKEVPNCVPKKEQVEEEEYMEIEEAEYQGKKVTLNKPVRSSNGPKKFHVYVRNDKGNVVKVNFGDPNMEIRKDNPKARKSFRARHKCDQKKDKTTAGYWSCKKW